MPRKDPTLPLSALQHWLYCPRQCALIHNEQARAENRFTAEGQVLHKKANEGHDSHLTGITSQHLSSERHLRNASKIIWLNSLDLKSATCVQHPPE